MKTRRLLGVLIAATSCLALIVACKKKSNGCPDAPTMTVVLDGGISANDDIDDSTLKPLMEAAIKDPKVCGEYTSPKLTASLATDDIVLTVGSMPKRNVGRPSAMSPSEIQRVNLLYSSLRSYRTYWKQIHPGSSFESNLELAIDPAMDTPRAASIILTAAHAGYVGVRITTASEPPFRVESYMHGPPDSRYVDRILHIEEVPAAVGGKASVGVRLLGPVCDKTPVITVPYAELGATVARLCKENPKIPSPSDPSERMTTRCVDDVTLRVLDTTRFRDTSNMLRAIVTALADQKPTIDIALLLVGSEPKMHLLSKDLVVPWSLYAPGTDASAHCTLPDGGYDRSDDWFYKARDGGGPRFSDW